MRLFRLDELAEPEGVPGRARAATTDDRALLVSWVTAFADEAGGHVHDAERVVDRCLETGRAWLWVDDGHPGCAC